MRRIWGWVAFLVVLVLVGFFVSRGKPRSTAATGARPAGGGAVTAVTVAPAESGQLTAALSLTGTVSAINSVQINPQTSGVVATLGADVGQKVTSGQVLATLNDSGVAESNLATAQAQLAQAQLQLKQDENPAAFVTSTALTQAQLAVQVAEATLKQQQYALTAAQQAVDITAPGAGAVEVVNVNLGQAVSTGQSLLQIIAPNSPVLVMAQVPQSVTVATGTTASIWVPALGVTTGGTVTAVGLGGVSPSTTLPSSTKGGTVSTPPTTAGYIGVQITVGNPPAGLRDGMTTQVSLTVPQTGGEAPQNVQASGTIQFANDWTVTAPSGGSIGTLSVNPGDTVTAGQLLGTIASPALQTAIDKAQAAVAQSQTQLQQAQASLQALQTPPPAAQATIDAQRQVVAEMQASLSLRQQQLAELTIAAPFDGTIQARNVSVGATVSPATALFALVGSGVNAQVPVPQQSAGQVKVGDAATIDAQDGGPALPGKIQSISPSASSQSLTFTAYIAPDQPSARLLPGAAVGVEIITAQIQNATVVPASTIQTVNGQTSVYIVKSGVATLVPVHLGPSGLLGGSSTTMTQVLSGVTPGDQVVTSDTTYLGNGTHVIVSGGAGAAGGGQRATGSGTAGRGRAATASASPRTATGSSSAGGH